MHGEPLLPPDFPHFPFVDPLARKGGRLSLGRIGSYDSLNPFIVRGTSAAGLREYVYESLMARSHDEPFSLYGLLAESVEMADDRGAITFHLRPEARFSDGHPLGVDDVLFSLAVLREKGWPYHRSYYRKVARSEATGPSAVTFTLDGSGDREMPLILGLMPILPRHLFTSESFDRTTLEPPIGSGPYAVAHVDAGRSIVYRRNEAHWGKDLPVYQGRFNFGEIRIEYYREASALLEAFKTGQVHVRVEDDPTVWAEGYGFPAVLDGRVVRREIKTGLPAGLSALVFNTRRPLFADPRVRRALCLMFDFEWINRNLFHALYRRSASLFERSELAAAGRPADAMERALLAPFSSRVPPAVVEGASRVPATDGTGSNRRNLREAFDLLAAAGYHLAGETLVDGTGRPFIFEFLASSRGQERLILSYARTLERLGIRVQVRQVDSAQYWSRLKSFDFDMIQWTWAASLSPGNEQLNRWSSTAARMEGSLNYAGVQDPAVDAMLDALLKAASREAFVAAARALDRVVMSGDYVIPLFHAPQQWVAHWHDLASPPIPPLFGLDLDTWWSRSA